MKSCNTVYCAAPTGNRFWANQNPELDFEKIKNIINQLTHVSAARFVLISTVDTIHSPDSYYGKHRKFLESFVSQQFQTHHIIRLCSLIGPEIKKNILYDIKNCNQFAKEINGSAVNQWYLLSRLPTDIRITIDNNIKEINLVSEPIANKDLLENFNFEYNYESLPYDIGCDRATVYGGQGKYILPSSQIKKYVREYLND